MTYYNYSSYKHGGYDGGGKDDGAISGRMFTDSNSDDTEKDANGNLEDGISGQKVYLFDSDGKKVGETKTASDGSYKFTNLDSGKYYVKFPTSVDGDDLVDKDQGDYRYDSDASQSSGKTNWIRVDKGEKVDNIDAGYDDEGSYDPGDASITGRMFFDTNKDDTENADNGLEPGIGGQTVELLDKDGNVVATTTTDDNGVYKFDGLTGGEYSVRFPTKVDDQGLVEKDVGSVYTDSDADQNTGETITFTVQPGCEYKEIDAGYEVGDSDGGNGDECDINFDEQATGTVIDDEYVSSEGVKITAFSNTGAVKKAMIFDTDNPTGYDYDLATQNLGKVLIISEDGDSSDPDDEADGGMLRFEFEEPVVMERLTVLDVEEGAWIKLYDADGNLLKQVDVYTDNNGQKVVDLGDTGGVYRMDVILGGSGAIDNICYEPDCTYDGTVEGTAGDDIIDADYEGDPECDKIDNGDAVLPGAAPNDDLVLAGDGDDTVLAGDGDDEVYGGDGDDDLSGDAGDDTLLGECGNDDISGGEGDDLVRGGGDDDVIAGNAGNDALYGGGDDDTIEGNAGDDTIYGDMGDLGPTDTCDGDPGDDYIDGGDGDDVIYGEGGDDRIIGGAGNDTAYGGDGDDDMDDVMGTNQDNGDDDLYFGGAGNDSIYTGLGDDELHGDDGNDIVRGEDGDDAAFGECGDDEVLGGDGNDLVSGGGNDDFVAGNAGDDKVYGGGGDDTVTGGQGDDVLYGDMGDLGSTDDCDGVAGDDTIEGGTGDDQIFGEAGNDTMSGGAGDDMLFGGLGDDLFVGGDTDDMVTGGEDPDGNDWDVLDLTGSNVDYIDYDDPGVGGGAGDEESGRVYFNDGTTMTFKEIENVIPCFTPGTLIATPQGEKLVEDLREGDRVLTRDNGIQEIRWTGAKEMSGIDLIKDAHLKPVLIKAGALGHGLPERDMIVSPNHRVLIANDRTQLYFEESEVLASAKHLVGTPGIHRLDVLSTTYIHFMFDRHEVVLSNGAWTESFQPGDWSLKGIDADQRDEIFSLFPELKVDGGLENYTAARKSLKKYEAKLLTV